MTTKTSPINIEIEPKTPTIFGISPYRNILITYPRTTDINPTSVAFPDFFVVLIPPI